MIDLFDASAPVFLRYLGRLSALVDAAEQHAASADEDPATTLTARLAPDMLPFEAQVRVAVNFSLRASFPLAGLAVPSLEGQPAVSFADLQARISRATAMLLTLERWQFEDAEAVKVVEEQAGRAKVSLPPAEFLLHYALPNFFFHLTSAYAILRSRGVKVGKADFDGFHAYP